MIWRWHHRNPRFVDLSLVGLLLALSVGVATRAGDSEAAAILGAAQTLPLLVRRRFPASVLIAVAAGALAMIALDVWIVPLQLGVALYTLTSLRSTARERWLAVAAISTLGIAVLASGGLDFGAAAARVVFLIAAALLGESTGSRRAYVREIEEKAARLEREREAETRRAAAEEQSRIARELHDVIAHALSVIIVQAGAATDAFRRDPLLAREPVGAIDTAARVALADLRRVLGILQSAPDYEPQPRLAQLDGLADRIRATGLKVAIQVEGTPRALPAAVELSAYRVVQEALTNALKHADAEHVRIAIRYGPSLEIDVRDDGRSRVNGSAAHGSGLIGMRERVTLLGGDLTTGPAAGGGYRVAATIPIEPAP